jgi:hypothetical protein
MQQRDKARAIRRGLSLQRENNAAGTAARSAAGNANVRNRR